MQPNGERLVPVSPCGVERLKNWLRVPHRSPLENFLCV